MNTFRSPSVLRPGALAAVLLFGFAAPAALAQETPVTADSRRDLTLTVYNQNLGLVSETRRVELPAGESLLAIEDVPGQLQPESVLLTAPGLQVIEQSLDADLLTEARLLQASVGKTVLLIHSNMEGARSRVEEARLLSIAGGDAVLQVGDRIEVVPGNGRGFLSRVGFKEVPPGLRSAPVLLARVFPGQAGASDLQIDYLTGGLSWRADYVARLDERSDRLDLSALVTLTNATDTDFEGATLRLVAGEVNQGARPQPPRPVLMAAQATMEERGKAADMSAPVAAADRYVYSLARPVSLKRGETKQIPLMSAQNVKVVREYRFEGVVSGHPGVEEIGPVNAALVLELENDPDLGLGAPLPAGTMRVYGPAQGASGGGQDAMLFLGADGIDHTPEGEKARLSLGEAFDVTARAQRTVYERLSQRSYESGQRVTVKNAKDEAVEVVLAGQMPQGWMLREESAAHEQVSANQVLWRITVPAGGETELTYRIRVSN